MRIANLAASALLLGGLPTAAAAQRAPDPVPIEEWSLEKVSKTGQEIYRHDVAAWVATDALLESFGNASPPAGMVGWIVVEARRRPEGPLPATGVGGAEARLRHSR